MEPGVVNPANAVTLARLLTIFPLWYCIHNDERQLAFVIILGGGLMDLVDGWVAKAFHCQSAFGEVFDAIADGLLYGSALVKLAVHGWAPRTSVAVIMGLGITNAAFRYIYQRRAGRTMNYLSLAMERFTGNLAFLIGFAITGYEVDFYFPVCTSLMVVIVIHDSKRMLFDPVTR